MPHAIAMELTVPVRVTTANIAEMRKRVLRGSCDVHGASTVVGKDGVVTNLGFCEDLRAIRLQPGWIVERYLTGARLLAPLRPPPPPAPARPLALPMHSTHRTPFCSPPHDRSRRQQTVTGSSSTDSQVCTSSA